MSEGAFFQDLALLMAVGGLLSAVFARLKWPKVAGYIVAGVFMGKHTWGGSFLADEQSVRTIGQLGVVFLMFSMGLGFSASQMKRIRTVAVPVAVFDTIVMTWLGHAVGMRLFGWGSVPSLFLGAAICDSATSMLAKVVDEMKWGDRPFVKYALGASVCEDVMCVGILAIVTGVAHGGSVSLSAAGMSLGGLLLFFLVVIVAGFVAVPRLLASVSKTRDDEALLLTILGFCFFVSWVAFKFEFSLALGAFLVGIIGASSDVRHRLTELADPLKSMFAAVFFVSIGLILDPSACFGLMPQILAVSVAIVVGKTVNCTLAAVVAGERVKTAVQMGLSLAQIGEFAFMVGMLYVTVTGDTASHMYNIVVASSLLTTLANPFLIRFSEPAGEWTERHLPRRVATALDAYRRFVEKYHESRREVRARKTTRKCLVQLGVIAAMNFAFALVFSMLAERDWSWLSPLLDAHKRFVFCLAAHLLAVAMLAPVVLVSRNLGRALGAVLAGAGDARWQLAARNLAKILVQVAAVALFFFETVMIYISLVPDEQWARIAMDCVLLAAAVFGWRFFMRAAKRASKRFDEALGADERREKLGAMLTFTVPEGTIHRLALDQDSPAIGGTVVTLNIRAKTGASVVSLERGGEMIRNIGPETEFRVGDVLFAMGDGAQVAALKDLLGIT